MADADDVLYASTNELINNSVETMDTPMIIAEKCISLHQTLLNEKFVTSINEARWDKERNLIAALRMISNNYPKHESTQTIRNNDPITTMKYIINHNSVEPNERTLKILNDIAKMIGSTQADLDEVKKLVIQSSLQKADSGDVEVVELLMTQKNSGVYKICAKLCIDNTANLSKQQRQAYALYALQHCPPDEISQMVSLHEKIEANTLVNELEITTGNNKNIVDCISMAHEKFSELAKESNFMQCLKFIGSSAIYCSSKNDTYLSCFGVTSDNDNSKLFKLKLLEVQLMLNQQQTIDEQTLIEFAAVSLCNGYLLSFVSVLLQVPSTSAESIKRLFDTILSSQPKNTPIKFVERTIQVFCFCLAVKSLLLMDPTFISDYFDEVGASDVIEKATEMESDIQHTSILSYFNGLLYLCSHVNTLRKYNPNISALDFITKTESREKILVDLSLTNDVEQLETVLEFSKQLNIESDQLYLNHLSSVMKTENVSSKEKQFIDSFLDELVVNQKDRVLDILSSSLEKANGTNLEKIEWLLSQMYKITQDKVREHQRNLLLDIRKATPAYVSIDFQRLIELEDNNAILVLMKPILNAKTVDYLLSSISNLKAIDSLPFYSFVVETELGNTNLEPKERVERVLPLVQYLDETTLRQIVTKLSFDNNFKIPLTLRISIMQTIIEQTVDPALVNEVKNTMFRLLAAKRIFQKQGIDNSLEVWDKYFRNNVPLIHVLANLALTTLDDSLVTSVLQDMKEEYEKLFDNTTNPVPLFMELDTKQAYLQIFDVLVSCLVE